MFFTGHEGKETNQDRRYLPCRVVRLRVKIRNRETKSCAGLEAGRWSVHTNCRRSEGIVGREDERPPVLTVMVGSIWRTGDYIVPSVGKLLVYEGGCANKDNSLEDILFAGMSDYVRRGALLDGLVFAG
jgi:hypothetical protein